MKVLVSRRPFVLRLDKCLALYCSLILLSSRGYDARTVVEEHKGTRIDEFKADHSKDGLIDTSRSNEESKYVHVVGVLNEKTIQQPTETLGKSDKEHEDAHLKDVANSRGAESVKKIRTDNSVDKRSKGVPEIQVEGNEQKAFKRMSKRPTRRWKRNDENIKDEVIDLSEKQVQESKSEISSSIGNIKRTDVEGIRRLDLDVEDDGKKANPTVSKVNFKAATPENINQLAEIKSENDDGIQNDEIKTADHGRSQDIKSDTQNTDINSSASLLKSSLDVENPSHEGEPFKNYQEIPTINENSETASSRAQPFARVQVLKEQAVEFQKKIRNSTFLHNLKGQASEILPDIPKFSEGQFLEILKNIISKNNLEESSDADNYSFKGIDLSDNQLEIIKCAQQLVAKKERQSFYDNISQCIRGLNIGNCMRIFIYPLIVENMPEALVKGFQNFPIEINVADILPGKQKAARQIPIVGFYTTQLNPDIIIFNVLVEALLRYPQQENLLSYIEEKNETLSKLLPCNRLQLLQLTEKFLPESERQSYSDEMLSCLRRFEYLSCIKYFSWPEIKKYYPSLPEFPISDFYLSSLVYPNHPLIPYPGFESGFALPEVIESGASRMKIETVLSNIFKKVLAESPRIPTAPTPIELKLILKQPSINQEQMTSIYLAEQLIPIELRTEYVSKTLHCITQFDYYNCMKYVTWPIIREYNLSLRQFPSFQELITNFTNLFSQFQIPSLIPQFQLPQLPSFPLPSLPNFLSFGLPAATTAKPPANDPPSDPSTTDTKKNDTLIETKIYKILKNVRDTMGATPLSTATYTSRKVFLFPLMTEDQSKIFALAEGILPPIAREQLITNTYFCLNDKNEFLMCARTILWPSIKNHVKGLPEFPADSVNVPLGEKIDTNTLNEPATESGDNFFIMREIEKIFFEAQEDAIYYIIRSIQSSPSEFFNKQKILELLRSIQFNAPEFLKNQIVQYPRNSELSTILTEKQENILHAVESLIPEELRVKFINEMIECAKKNKFSTCSRNIIYPYTYRYFQKALSVPYYNIISEKKVLLKEAPVRLEMKISTEKQEGNLVMTTDSKILPTFSINSETAVFNMLRKVILGEPSILKFPNKSIAYSKEFQQAFSLRQTNILIVAEAILPEQYRNGFLEEIYECIKNDSFLNCTRDKLFPVMAKVYSDFSVFSNFEIELSRSEWLSIIELLNKPFSLQKSLNPRKVLPSLDILCKYVPENKRNGLQILIDKLPNSLYYDLYIKMSQCTQFSDGISCGHDIIYPTLKQYYNSPEINVDEYYPITAQVASYSAGMKLYPTTDFEIICENMGFTCTLAPFGSRYAEGFINIDATSSSPETSYIPFGKLSDGSRIFKYAQDIWTSVITPSVGESKDDISKYTSQPSANYISLSKRSIHPLQNQQTNNAPSIQKSVNKSFKRSKRNIDDLLDSYSDAIPDVQKNSVRRRMPPKLTFPNITETELLQILVNISKPIGIRKPEMLYINEYFVDSLNSSDRAMLTADQYEILKLVQNLNSNTAKAGFMSRIVQCIRSLSFLRCIRIFVWPMIASNLPSLPFNFPVTRSSRVEEEKQIQELFGVSALEFENELISRKEQIESNFIELYKSLTEEKFETYLGPLKIRGQGNGELAISISGYREGRLSKIKDNKSLPSILTIISEVIEEVFDTKPNKTKSKKEMPRKDKRGRSLFNFENSSFETVFKNTNEEHNAQKSIKDDQVINMLLERLRPSSLSIEDEATRNYYNLEDAHRAFQVLFGPKPRERLSNQLKSIESDNLKMFDNNYDEMKVLDELKLIPLEMQEKNLEDDSRTTSLRGRALHGFNSINERSGDTKKDVNKSSKFKTYAEEYINKYVNLNRKKIQTGLVVRLPRLTDDIASKKMTSNLMSVGREMKTKMKQMMPLAGLAVSFLIQLALAHSKAAASVAGILSNMALGSAMLGLIRDMIFGSNNQSKTKVIYDTEKYGSGISWPATDSGHSVAYTTHNSPSPHFHQLY